MQPYAQSAYTVRFGDCDPFRHLNNARYVDYFINAREDHLRDQYQFELASYFKKGIGWVISQHEIRYLRPASMYENIIIRSGLMEASSQHLLVEMLMLNESQTQLKAVMHSQFIPVSLTTGKRETHDDAFMQFVTELIVTDTPAPHLLTQRIQFWQQQIAPIKSA